MSAAPGPGASWLAQRCPHRGRRRGKALARLGRLGLKSRPSWRVSALARLGPGASWIPASRPAACRADGRQWGRFRAGPSSRQPSGRAELQKRAAVRAPQGGRPAKHLGISQPINQSTKELWPHLKGLEERRPGYHSRAGLEPGTSGFSTLRMNHCAARGTAR
jgi:hypothetical protein